MDNKATGKIKRFILRLLLSTALVSAFFVVTQDFQIFPGILPGLFETNVRENSTLPQGIVSTFVRTVDEQLIEVWHLPLQKPQRSQEKDVVALLFHGNAETVENMLHIQRWLQSLGIASYSFDYRGYGKSSGWPSEAGIYNDAEAVYQLFNQEYNRSNTALLILGSSIGSGPAAYLASRHSPDILLLLSPYTSLRDLISELPLFGLLKDFAWYDFPTSRYINSLVNACVIAVHGTKDGTIPYQHTERLYQQFKRKENFKKLIIAGAGHNDLLARSNNKIAKAILSCLQQKPAE